MKKITEFSFWIFASVIVVIGYLSLGDLMKMANTKSAFSFELLAAILGSIITVASMAVMIRLQAKLEKESDYNRQLFDRKLTLYQDLTYTIFKMDDDNIIDHHEVMDVENKIGVACLVAHTDLVSTFSQFVYQLKTYGVVYLRSMNESQIEHFQQFVKAQQKKTNIHDSYLSRKKHKLALSVPENIENYFVSLNDLIQAIRDDLDVVQGDVHKEIEHFIRLPYNHESLVTHPNLVDPELHK